MTPQSSNAPCRAGEVAWWAPDHPADHRRLDAWCRGVGAPSIVAPAPPPADPVGIEEVTFVSWNVHVGNGDIETFVRHLRAGVHTGHRPVEHFVLMLQEAVRTTGVPPLQGGASGAVPIRSSRSGSSADINALSRQLGLSLIYVPSMRNGRSASDPAADRGNAILSTLPLSNPIAVELPGERQRRVAVFAKAGAVSVGVIHLDALGAPARLWVFWTPWMRARQVRAISGAVPDGPLVIGADLNTWHGIDESAARILERISGATPVEPSRHGLGLRVLDYLFFRAGPDRRAHYRQLSDAYGSDHKPLIGWIE